MIWKIAWEIYCMISLKVCPKDPEFKGAWTATRPRLRKVGDYILDKEVP